MWDKIHTCNTKSHIFFFFFGLELLSRLFARFGLQESLINCSAGWHHINILRTNDPIEKVNTLHFEARTWIFSKFFCELQIGKAGELNFFYQKKNLDIDLLSLR